MALHKKLLYEIILKIYTYIYYGFVEFSTINLYFKKMYTILKINLKYK